MEDERKLSDRALDAIQALRKDEFVTLGVSHIKHERKEAPDYGQSAPIGVDRFSQFRFTGWGWNKGLTSGIDYSKEVGNLDESSLVMAVCNDTGIALAEAAPSVRRRDAKNKWESEPEHPLAQIIENPNPFNTWPDYCGALSLSWWIDGNVYFRIEPSLTGEVAELWYLPHFLVEERWPDDGKSPEVPTSGPNKATNNYLSHYQFDIPGKEPRLYRQDEVLHIKRFVDPSNPRRGLGAFIPVIREIYGDQAVATFAATLMKNMGVIPYVISPKEKDVSIGPVEAEAIKEKFIQRTTGAGVGQPIVNAIPLDVQKLGSNLQEMDVSNLRRAFEIRVSAVSRYPAAYLQFLAGLENGTSYASYREAREQAYEQVVIPIQRSIGKQITKQLLPRFDKDKGAQFFFDTTEVRVLQEDRDALYKRESDALRAGGITLNQYLSSLGKEPLGEDGDVYYMPIAAQPMTLERIIDSAQIPEKPEGDPLDASVISDGDKLQIAKMADIDRWMDGLEKQMQEFLRANPR